MFLVIALRDGREIDALATSESWAVAFDSLRLLPPELQSL